jgi:iron complex outermembrane recepter protein
MALTVAAGVALSFGLTDGARAADAPAKPAAANGQAPSQGAPVGEIMVTATKGAKAVDVAKVPMSIAAYSQANLDHAGVVTLEDLFTRTPGVNFTRQAAFGTGFTSIAIRGVQSRTSQPTTGIYLDDTPLSSFGNNTNLGGSNAYPIIFDLASVEILRGPQGTLFGSGSEGGTVRFLTNDPSVTHMSFYGKGELSGTEGAGGVNYETGAAEGGPIVQDKLGFRISADYRHDAGWVDHCTPAVAVAGCLSVQQKDANTIDSSVFQGALLWKPVEWLSVEPSIHYQKYHQANPSEIELGISNPDQGIFRQAHSKNEPVTDQLFIPSLKIVADLPGVTATSSTAYVWRKNRFYTDYTVYQDFFFFDNPYPLTGAPDDFGLGKYGITQNDFSEEFRLASNNNSRLTWLIGGFFDVSREVDYAHVIHPDLPNLIQSIYGATISQILGVDPYQGVYVAFNNVATTDKQEAVFANADYKVTDAVKVTVGGRYAHYSEHVNSFIAGPFNGTNGETFIGDTSGDTFDPKAVITWQPDGKSLFYISGAKGFRPGGYNAQVNNAQPACQAKLASIGLVVPRTYAPDSIWSVEGGTKQRLFDDHLAIDLSIYHNNWNNIQLSEQIADCGFGAILNLGKAQTEGFDLNIQSQIGDHIKANVAIGYTDGKFTQNAYVGDPNKGAPQAVAQGDQISGLSAGPAIPPWTITASLEYDFMLSERPAYLRVEDIYHSKNYGPFSQQEKQNTVVYDPILPDEPANNMINLRFGMKVIPAAEVSLFVDNLANSHPLMSTFHVGLRGFYPSGAPDSDPRFFANTFTPRTWGMNLIVHY